MSATKSLRQRTGPPDFVRVGSHARHAHRPGTLQRFSLFTSRLGRAAVAAGAAILASGMLMTLGL